MRGEELIRSILIGTLTILAVLFGYGSAQAAPKAELWARWQKHDPGSTQKIDHGAWDRFLKQFVVAPHPSGIHRVRYQAVQPGDLRNLKIYLQAMQAVAISSHNRVEQKAYWINVYNALTVDLILARFPVASIRDINISPGFLSRGPWGAKLFGAEGERLSLDDIEHRILRPIWKDSRVHYAVNCASLGCPNLQPLAFTGENTEGLLEKAARECGAAKWRGALQPVLRLDRRHGCASDPRSDRNTSAEGSRVLRAQRSGGPRAVGLTSSEVDERSRD